MPQPAIKDWRPPKFVYTGGAVNRIIAGNILICICLLFSLGSKAYAQRPAPKKTMIKGEIMYTVLKPGAIPAIFEPEFISVNDADEFFYPDEPIIAVIDGDSAKGYSAWYLDHHEVVNDYINGKAITVTW